MSTYTRELLLFCFSSTESFLECFGLMVIFVVDSFLWCKLIKLVYCYILLSVESLDWLIPTKSRFFVSSPMFWAREFLSIIDCAKRLMFSPCIARCYSKFYSGTSKSSCFLFFGFFIMKWLILGLLIGEILGMEVSPSKALLDFIMLTICHVF